jgi:hypothetical protein
MEKKSSGQDVSFLPLTRMADRVEIDRSDSDIAAFYALLFYGEMLTKIVVAGLVASITETKERHQYRLLHDLVRVDAIGDWAKALDEILLGPTSQFLQSGARHEQRQLTQRVPAGSWQHGSVVQLQGCLQALELPVDPLAAKVAGRQWFGLFAQLRNKTRGHGAPRGGQCSEASAHLEKSIKLMVENFGLFARPWAFLRRNLSGKYRVTPFSGDRGPFENFTTGALRTSLTDGLYVAFDEISRAHLIETDADASDILLPNGQFDGSHYEILSYITSERRTTDAGPFLAPTGPLPASETQGTGVLDAIGGCFANLPEPPTGYIRRKSLEEQLREQLTLERHPIVTLTGPGGIGKTYLALQLLHDLARDPGGRYASIVWLSARDIDLLPEGPKPVRPAAVRLEDFAREFVRLLEPPDGAMPGFREVEYFAKALEVAPLGPCLFVFDNLETVAGPADVFRWIDTYIRSPNKVLITSRMRDFIGDWQIEVSGMTESEAQALVDSVAPQLGIRELLTSEFTVELFKESDYHPYVLKILLGEVAKAGRLVKPERIIAGQDDILKALFERSYTSLSMAAQRVFLVLCNWRSVVAEVVLEAVLLRPENERMDVKGALEELRRTSFVETIPSPADGENFVGVPRSAMAFGRRKLTTSPFGAAVQVDTTALQDFGPVRKEEVRHGVLPRVQFRLRRIAEEVASNKDALRNRREMLEFIAQRVPGAWLNLASLYEELGGDEGVELAKTALRRYLEKPSAASDNGPVWERLARICARARDYVGEVHALVSMAQEPSASLKSISNAANRINDIHRQLKRVGRGVFDSAEKRALIARVVPAMTRHHQKMDATDCSRLAWLHLQLGETAKARKVAQRGVELDPGNYHCRALLERLIP